MTTLIIVGLCSALYTAFVMFCAAVALYYGIVRKLAKTNHMTWEDADYRLKILLTGKLHD